MEHHHIVEAACIAAQEVFTTMLGSEIKPGEPFVEQGFPAEAEAIVALVGLAGPWIGTGIMSCSPALACQMSSSMLMAEYTSVDSDVLDAVAEVANMIIGNMKTVLEEQVGQLMLSVPTVVYGKNFCVKSMGYQNWTVVPFSVGSEQLAIKIYLTPNHDGQSSPRAGFVRSYALNG